MIKDQLRVCGLRGDVGVTSVALRLTDYPSLSTCLCSYLSFCSSVHLSVSMSVCFGLCLFSSPPQLLSFSSVFPPPPMSCALIQHFLAVSCRLPPLVYLFSLFSPWAGLIDRARLRDSVRRPRTWSGDQKVCVA